MLGFCSIGGVLAITDHLLNPSFESPYGLAVDWLSEENTTSPVTYSTMSSVHQDGVYSQLIAYEGHIGDVSRKCEIYQSVNSSFVVGQTLFFNVSVIGSCINDNVLIGVEGFDSSGHWVNERDNSSFVVSDVDWHRVSVYYVVPSNVVSIAVYVQCYGISSSTINYLYVDNSTLEFGSNYSTLISNVDYNDEFLFLLFEFMMLGFSFVGLKLSDRWAGRTIQLFSFILMLSGTWVSTTVWESFWPLPFAFVIMQLVLIVISL